MRPILVAGLDIGSTRTRVVIGELTAEFRRPDVRVLGVGSAPTVGVRKDVVTDLGGATRCIREAIEEAETMSGARVDRMHVGVSGDHVKVNRSAGVVAIAAEEVVERDVRRVHEVAQAVALPMDRELLHAIPQDYLVDRRWGIKNPVGMTGTRLEAELYLVTGCSTVVGNVARAVERAGYRVEDMIINPLASARSVLAEDEKELGVTIIDLGGATTGLAVFRDGRILTMDVLPFGGSAVTSDVIRGLSIPFAEATEVRERHGTAMASMVDPTEIIELPAVNGNRPGERRRVARRTVAALVEERLTNMFLRVARRIAELCPQDALGAGVVLTGGMALTPGIDRLAHRCLGAPVRVGAPGEGFSGLADRISRPGFATAAGLALHAADRFLETGRGGATRTSGLVTRVGAWLKEFF